MTPDVLSGKLTCLRYFVNNTTAEEINTVDRFGNTPLDDAVCSKRSSCAAFLRQHGALSQQSAKVRSRMKRELLHCCAAGDAVGAEKLLSMGDFGPSINTGDYDGELHFWTCLCSSLLV